MGPTDGKRLYDAAKEGHDGAVRMWLSKGVPWDAWKTEVSSMCHCFLAAIAWPDPLMRTMLMAHCHEDVEIIYVLYILDIRPP